MTVLVCKLCPFLRFIYETEHFNGVAELLEILGRLVFSIMPTHFEAHKHMLPRCFGGQVGVYDIKVKHIYMHQTFFKAALRALGDS